MDLTWRQATDTVLMRGSEEAALGKTFIANTSTDTSTAEILRNLDQKRGDKTACITKTLNNKKSLVLP